MAATSEALEASYKATRLQLSRILAFRARLQEHGASTYATQVPQTMVVPLKSEMDKFDKICEELEQRVMRAIATLERDARKAAMSKPIKAETEEPTNPLSSTSSARPTSITSESRQVGPETITLDDDLSDNIDSRPTQQSMELDLTLSPTPPPSTSTSTSTLPAPSTSEPLPFALPTSSDHSSSATSSTIIPALNPSSNLSAGADDLNALLTSLNMPPFDPNANMNFLAQGGVAGGGGGGTQTTEEALAALLGTNAAGGGSTTTSEPNLNFNLPPTSGASATGTGAGEQDLNLTGFDFSSISGLSTSLPPSSTSYSAAPSAVVEPQQNLTNLGGFDFSKFDANNGGAGLGGMDLSDLGGMGGSGNGGFDIGSSMDLGAGGGNGQMSEQEMQELLKSLGG